MMSGKRLIFQLYSTNNVLPKYWMSKCLRTFLSDAYKCETEWKGRINSPLLAKFKNENLYGELLKKFQNEGKASAIDVDLFSNLVLSDLHLDDLENITNKFRRCPNTVYTLPSTGHAVIRTFLQFNHTDALMRMLDDRLNFGLFLDFYLSNLLMDSFLKEGNHRDAAKVAIQLMLQEEFDHPITTPLALYSCYTYLKKPQPEPWDPQPKPKPEEPAEEVKVRVDYIREPYFDEHFDLTDPSQLIGKTLAAFGNFLVRKSPDAVAHSSLVLGWTLFEKYDNVLKSLDAILNSRANPLLSREWLNEVQKRVNESSKLPEGFLEKFNDRLSRLEAQGCITDIDIQDVLKKRVEEAVSKQEAVDIKDQKEAYSKWEVLRQEELQKQIDAAERRRRIAILEAKKKELQEKEQRLNFFDNVDEWELLYEEKEQQREAMAKELESRSKKISAKMQRLAEEEAYYPPEIGSNRG